MMLSTIEAAYAAPAPGAGEDRNNAATQYAEDRDSSVDPPGAVMFATSLQLQLPVAVRRDPAAYADVCECRSGTLPDFHEPHISALLMRFRMTVLWGAGGCVGPGEEFVDVVSCQALGGVDLDEEDPAMG